MATEFAALAPTTTTEHPRFRAILENTFDVIVILDTEGRIRYESPSIVRVLGYEPTERENQGAFDLVHPEDTAKTFGAVRRRPFGAYSARHGTTRRNGCASRSARRCRSPMLSAGPSRYGSKRWRSGRAVIRVWQGVEDHELARTGLRGMIVGEPDLEVVGEAATGQQAVSLCRRLRPDGAHGRAHA